MVEEQPAPRLVELFPDTVRVGRVLQAHGWFVAVAESCTGGLLGAVLTAAPGSSAYFAGGIIAYDNVVKEGLLGVQRHLLAAHGAVSEPVAAEMAAGVLETVGADVGVAITGVAGPAAEGDKPAGLVYVALRAATGGRVVRLEGDHGRDGNRAAAVRAALRLLIELA